MKYISTEKTFDVKTLWALMSSTEADIKDLINRNVDRFRKSYIKNNSGEIENLNEIISEYEKNLASKISITKLRLDSTDNGMDLNQRDATNCFMKSFQAVKDSIEELHVEVPNEIQEAFDDAFEYQKSVALEHMNMFMSHYRSELETTDEKYLKSYVHTMIQHGYLFESAQNDYKYSLFVFLSFYEAYAKRIVGLSLLDLCSEELNTVLEESIHMSSESYLQLHSIVYYLKKTTLPMAKSCYFLELQKRYKGDISEFIKRFLIDRVGENNKIQLQKRTLIDKIMLRTNKCIDIIDPPVTIPTPLLIDRFFQISDSHYTIM